MALRSILIADDEEPVRHVLTELLSRQGYFARAVEGGEEALRELAARDYDALVTDVRMPKMDGLALVRAVQESFPETTVIVMSAYGSHDLALQAMKAGAYDYLGKPFRPDEVLLVLRKAEERERLRVENRRLRREIAATRGSADIVAGSGGMKEVLRLAQKVAPAKTTVLIAGESGTGKELIARAIHELSPRAGGPFVAVNCGAIPEPLIESELFGHAKGAFTGAQGTRRGLFEEADGGTLFLDEVGDLPLQLQVSLLRALQEGEIRRVGDTRTIKVDVRVLAATHRDLQQAVSQAKFREDLYYRLNVVGLKLPPLRERPEEIPELAARFVDRHASRLGLPRRSVSAAALRLLESWRWPGNVRELENALERALVLSDGDEIEPEALPEEMRASGAPRMPPQPPGPDDLSVKRAQRALELDLIRRALEKTGGNRTRAAELLELSERALRYKIREYGLGE
jgi:two-component system response regulator AtoC